MENRTPYKKEYFAEYLKNYENLEDAADIRMARMTLKMANLWPYFSDRIREIWHDLIDDERTYEDEWIGWWQLTITRRIEWHDSRGGDSYCGIWENVPEVTLDSVEVVDAYDTVRNEYDPEMVKILNTIITECY